MTKMLGPELENSFKELSERFLDWLNRNGTNISHKIGLVDLRIRGSGRGVIAKTRYRR